MSEADWEKEDYEPPQFTPAAAGDKWEGEDEEEDVKENWDDDEDRQEDPSQEIIPAQTKKKKPLGLRIAEREEKKRKEAEAKKSKEVSENNITPEELLAEKQRQQLLQEEADLLLAKEAFGNVSASQTTTTMTTSIDSLEPVSKDDFDVLRRALTTKLTLCEKSALYIPFLDDLLRDISLNLDAEDIKKLSSTLNAIANEKVKAQKGAKHKKKAKKGASLNIGKNIEVEDEYANEYEDFM